MSIEPDAKDWTWVLERPCPECGFDATDVAAESVAGRIRENAAGWTTVLGRTDVRDRPRPDVWSPLEYACHVRDVYRLYDERLHLMLDEDAPRYPNWDQDLTAIEDRYGEQDPAVVHGELQQAAEALAASFESVSGDQWERTGTRSDGAEFTVTSFARYLIHDPVHHLHDVSA